LNTPLVDIACLQNIYDITEMLINEKKYEEYKNLLDPIGDIEKIYRKMLLGIVQ